jgi:sugar lactone lactonase YvrE
MKVDARDRLWVAGGPAGSGYVFDAASGEPLATFAFAVAPTFINDVVVTRSAAYFTDSMRPAIYRVPIGPDGEIGEPATIALDPAQIGFVPGAFNLNGIEATAGGAALIVVNSTAGALFAIDTATWAVAPIDLGGSSVTAGDGILLHGRTLYVVRNQLDLVAVVDLAADLASGTLVDEITSGGFDVPTTVARFGSSLYVVNARFGRVDPTPPPDPYWVTRVDR